MSVHPPPPLWHRILHFVSGIGLVILGIIGLILPIMPGWVFLIPGLIILADFFPPIHRLVQWGKSRMEDELDKRWTRKPPDS
jgi:uncharacterized membrane protein YbaN (DUF454 family)